MAPGSHRTTLGQCGCTSSLAAYQGNAEAQSNLGVMHANGIGVPQDHTEAARLFKLADEQGNQIGTRRTNFLEYRGTTSK